MFNIEAGKSKSQIPTAICDFEFSEPVAMCQKYYVLFLATTEQRKRMRTRAARASSTSVGVNQGIPKRTSNSLSKILVKQSTGHSAVNGKFFYRQHGKDSFPHDGKQIYLGPGKDFSL